MRPINEAHVAEPGLAVVEVAAADDETALAVQGLLATRWAIAPADRTTHEPGEPGVRLRCFLDLRQRSEHEADGPERAVTDQLRAVGAKLDGPGAGVPGTVDGSWDAGC
jgi:hypothetical protein